MSGEWFHLLNVIGVAFFAVSGTLLAHKKDVDGLGIVVLASVTALGGGTLRDILLNQPVFWVAHADYLYATYAAVFVTVFLIRVVSKFSGYYFLLADAFGLGLYNIVGIEKSLINDAGMVVAITLGTITCIFGGLIRDVICSEIPLVLRGGLYATACIAGGLVYAALFLLDVSYGWCIIASLATTVFLRLGAIRWNWEPTIFKRGKKLD
ncbi:trimeric intracellular cation channel family protein [Alteromonas pelagimontana]|uniref:Trimeric intracellular cation channel family protein n=1 Tax=Alteromonas pelagimontana TaxID=1858656 RepID=A0A6M4MH63_9ALTE|nr:trimeric intracellular cation channel family protein [Alteromonas pelagimontana]QJR81930.1 trimeric intracellular cation channel family protein [Alteromonas pelagimontana]